MRHLLPVAVLLTPLFCGLAVAQPTKDPAKIRGGTFNVDPDHTQVIFGIDHLGFSTYYGRFANVTGSLELQPTAPAASKVDISLPTATVSTTSEKLDGTLKSADWLDAEKYPTVTFRSTAVKPTTGGKAEIVGDLTLHGVTRPVTLHAELHGAGTAPMIGAYTIGFQATGQIKRTDFGVSKYVPYIGDEVSLTISAAFVKP